jgi:hypothetical protein
MKKLLAVVAAALALGGCGGGSDVVYKPTPLILPANIQKLALRLVVNKTQQFGLEDKFTLRVRDEFLRNGRFPLVPEANADGIIAITITRYLLTPVQFDASLIPIAYKLRMIIDVSFIDRASNTTMWTEPNLEGILTYNAATLPGGYTEEQAREQIYDALAPDVVKRVIGGFGAVTGSSLRRVSPDAPSTAPKAQPNAPLPPVVPNPY